MILFMLGLLASLVGLAGYVLVPGKVLDQEKYLRNITVFYMILSISPIVHALCHLVDYSKLIEVFIGVLFTVAALYLIIRTETRLNIKISRLRDALLYASVIWLMGKELEFLSSVESYFTVLVGLISSAVSVITLRALMEIKKHRTYFILEECSTIFSDSFFAVFIMGLGLIALGDTYSEGTHSLTMLLAASIILYVLFKIKKSVKPYLRS